MISPDKNAQDSSDVAESMARPAQVHDLVDQGASWGQIEAAKAERPEPIRREAVHIGGSQERLSLRSRFVRVAAVALLGAGIIAGGIATLRGGDSAPPHTSDRPVTQTSPDFHQRMAEHEAGGNVGLPPDPNQPPATVIYDTINYGGQTLDSSFSVPVAEVEPGEYQDVNPALQGTQLTPQARGEGEPQGTVHIPPQQAG